MSLPISRPHLRPDRARGAVALTARAANRFVSEQLESRTLLAAASIYDVTPAPLPYGPQQVVMGTATAQPLELGSGAVKVSKRVTVTNATLTGEPATATGVTPTAVSGVVFQNHGAGSGYGSFGYSGGIIGFDDYDSINNANITLSELSFIGGVGNAGGTLEFEFYTSANVFVAEIIASLPNTSTAIWSIALATPLTIPDAGFLQIRAQAGSTATWFLSDAQPTIGTQSNALGNAAPGTSFKFGLTNTPANNAPTIASLSDSPDPVAAGGNITLTANSVNDSDGTIANVNFYRESNGTTGLQTGAGGDLLLTTDSTGPTYDAVVSTTGLTNGTYLYYAQATDNLGLVSNVVSTTNTVGIGSISGVAWNDANGNKIFDGGESTLSGWTVFLDQNRNQTLDGGEVSTTTDGSGAYTFTNLAADTYFVTTVTPPGWTQTFPGAIGQVSAAGAGGAFASAAPALPTITTTGSAAPVYPIGQVSGVSTNGSSGQITTLDAQSNSLIRLTNFQADARFSTIRGQNTAVAVLDTGIDLDHPFFGPDVVAPFGVADRIVYQQDFADGDMDASDVNGHGTNVASIIGSQDSVHPGMAPQVDLIALKVFTNAGAGSFNFVEAALQWVVANALTYNIAAINMSLGDNQNFNSNQTLYGINDELATLAAMNVMVVSAAGNDFFTHGSAQGVSYPAADFNSLAVSAVYDANVGGPITWADGAKDFTTGADRIASFSQRSTVMTDIFAPGPFQTGGNSSGGTSDQGGTSQASPHIAGVAALAQQLALRDLGRKLTLAEYRSLLTSSGVTINDGDDENDNVTNTGANFKRVDVLALGEAIRALAISPFTHTVTLTAGQSKTGINFGNQNNDVTPPTADIVDVTPDPRLTNAGDVTINFSEAVTGVDASDFTLTRDGIAVDLTGVGFVPVSPSQYAIDLTSRTVAAGKYVLTLVASGSGIQDSGGNPLAANASDEWLKNSVEGAAADDTIKLVRNGSVINVFINNVTATPNYTADIGNLGANALVVQGLGGNDTISIDFSGPGGAPAPAAGLSVDGGTHSSGDTLILTGTSGADAATFTTSSFNFGATTIGYVGVESHLFNGGAGPDTLNVNAGTYNFDNDANVGNTSLSVNVAAPAIVHFNASQHLDALTVSGEADLSAGGSKVLVVNSLAVTGKLNLRNHDAVIHYSGASPIGVSSGSSYDGITGLIASGRNGNAWNGNGILTSESDATTGLTTLGIAEASSVLTFVGLTATFSGETVDGTTVLIKYTYGGDANLDGFVSGDDYTAIDFAIAVPGAFGYRNGDFNFDGFISADDYTVIDFNIAAQGPPH